MKKERTQAPARGAARILICAATAMKECSPNRTDHREVSSTRNPQQPPPQMPSHNDGACQLGAAPPPMGAQSNDLWSPTQASRSSAAGSFPEISPFLECAGSNFGAAESRRKKSALLFALPLIHPVNPVGVSFERFESKPCARWSSRASGTGTCFSTRTVWVAV